MWPASPALPVAPRISRPSSISPAPRPVPKVKKAMLSSPRPAPKRHSARAQALASFSRNAGAPRASWAMSVTGTLSQAGRLGGHITTPRFQSRGPPQENPQASGVLPRSSFLAADSISSMASRQVPGVKKAALSTMRMPFSSFSPRHTAHLVPPMSKPV